MYTSAIHEVMRVKELPHFTGFQWDEGNREKNWTKHRVSPFECEEVFLSGTVVVRRDAEHSRRETRCYALGRTFAGRPLSVVFTVRGTSIRVISAREMTTRELKEYGRHEAEDSEV